MARGLERIVHNGKQYVIHSRDTCEPPCLFHSPSDHRMKGWDWGIRYDKDALIERFCDHGIGHPDPDSLAYFARLHGRDHADALGIHGCDGCCHAV